jgi:RNA polymerase sigma-70 factor, ECF subfamily
MPEPLPPSEPEDSDLDLIQESVNGSTKAFDTLVIRYSGRVHAMIYNLVHNEADAWDLTQETFIKAWKALKNFELRSGFYTWLYRIAHNVTYDNLRKKKIQGESEFDDAISHRVEPGSRTTPGQTNRPDEMMERSELGGKIKKALDQLSEDHRTVILLKEVQGMRYHEIAKVMNCSEGTVMSRLFYARKKLQTMLQEEYHEHR